MLYEIQYQPSCALAVVHLDSGEHFRAEVGAMVSMEEVKGPGRFYFQTHSPRGFLDWLIPKLPQ